MQCAACHSPLNGHDISVYLVGGDAVEVQLACTTCPAVFSNWISHTAWADGNSEPADLTSPPEAQKVKPSRKIVRAQRVKEGRS